MDRREMFEIALKLMLAEERRLVQKLSIVTANLQSSEAERHKVRAQYERITAAIQVCELEMRQGRLL